MKAIIKTAYAVYSSDGRGYSQGDPFAIYPFQAAAEASEENKHHGYSNVVRVELLQFEEVSYLLRGRVNKDRVFGSVRLGVPESAYQDYSYNDGFDKSVYLVGNEKLIKHLEKNKRGSISKIWITRDESDYFVLESEKTFSIKPFVLSRELAIKNALSKLSDEEKKLLGIN